LAADIPRSARLEMATRSNPSLPEHQRIVAWALACAERSLGVFERDNGGDLRPGQALDALRAWIEENASTAEVRTAALAAHTAARESESEAARLAARSAAQAAGVVQSVSHAPHAASYARRAIEAAGGDAVAELAWQRSMADDVVKAFLQAQIQERSAPPGDDE
jgi:hypothetical protein